MNYEDLCEKAFRECDDSWHLYTPGDLSRIIFRTLEEYIFGMNLVALCAAHFKGLIDIFTFQIMSNHFHFVLQGDKNVVISFFEELRKRLVRYLSNKNRFSDLKGFSYSIIKIESISYMRNLITYVNRNGYLIDRDSTPFSYTWGGNAYFFNKQVNDYKQLLLKELSIKKKREIFKTHDIFLPDNYFLINGYVSPVCYLNIELAEKFFRNAHHYFNLVSRRVELFAQIAKELGDSISYTDEELNSAIYYISSKKFGTTPKVLTKQQKIEVAKELHFNYNASVKQIKRVLRLEESILNALFP